MTAWDKPLVDVAINGVPGRFVLDSGSTFTAVYDHFRQRAGLGETIGTNEAATTHGNVQMQVTEATRIDVANLSIQSVLLNIAPGAQAARFSEATGAPLPDGILGADILKRFHAVIDFASDTLVFRPSEPRSAGRQVVARLQELPMNGVGVEAVIDGSTVLLSIDSGRNSLGSLYTDTPVVATLRVVTIPPQRTFSLGSVREQGEAYAIHRLAVGGTIITNCLFAKEPAEHAWRPEKLPPGVARLIDGFLGAPFLKAHGLAIDYGRLELVQARSEAAARSDAAAADA